jgi:putative pre-16S rRNA nuclease
VRVLALDFGSTRCGCAVSDPTGTLATPIEALERPASRRGFARLVELVGEREVEYVVVGLPLRLAGGDSAQTVEVRRFAERLAHAVDVPVELEDERFTTVLAQQVGGRAAEDSRAAAILLQGWLSRRAASA